MPLEWLNYDAAMARARSYGDLAKEQFVMRAVTAVLTRAMRGDEPSGPFDLLFYVQTLEDVYAQRDAIAKLFAGEDLRWWPDDG